MGEAWTGPNRCPNGHEDAVRVQAWEKSPDGTKPCAREALISPLSPFPPEVDSFRFFLYGLLYCLQSTAVVFYKRCDVGSIIRSFGGDINSQLKIMLKVDSVYHTECSIKSIRNGYGLWFASYLVPSLIMLFFLHREIDYKHLICGRSSAFIISGDIILLVQPCLDIPGRDHPVISQDILLVALLCLCCVPSHPVPHMRCFSVGIVPGMAFAR